jgi:hypothetical protein
MITNQYAHNTVTNMLENKDMFTDIIFLYGTMNQDTVNAALRIIENKLTWLKFSKTLISKTKLIGVELMENIYKHQSKNSTMSPYFQVVLNPEGLSFYSGNSISPNNYEVLSEKLATYHTMTQEELKELYINKIGNEQINENGNMGLGLITIINRSNKKASHELLKISDEEYFFKLEVNINNSTTVS